MRAYRFALRPGWLVLHVVTVAMMVTMVLLGRWQLTVSNRKHFDLQNFGYAIQWWVFTAFAGLAWWRLLHDRAVRDVPAPPVAVPVDEPAPPVAYRRYVPPSAVPAGTDDPMRAAYNDYLSALAAHDEELSQ